MCRIARIDAFVATWPESPYGPAHIVLDDANLDDESLDYCIRLTEGLLDQAKRRPEDADLYSAVGFWRDHGPVELAETLAFLNELRAIPAAARVQPGDSLCPVLP